MDVVVVTVTYGDRFHYLKQVIDAVLAQGIDKIVVIDNGSHENSKNQLKALETELKDILHVTYLDRNYGSAGGFKRGMQEAEKLDKNFIYILDDDNLPLEGCLNKLLKFWVEINLNNQNNMLYSVRIDRKTSFQVVKLNKPELAIGTKNSFHGFDLANFIKRKFTKNKNPILNDKNYGEIHQAPYGGIFFHKNLIKIIGFPNEKFFLYVDDTEYTYRVIKNHGKIYALLDANIKDIELSYDLIKNKKKIYLGILNYSSNFRVYYNFRNRVYFELNNRVDNKIIYFSNVIIAMSRIFIYALLTLKLKRFKLLLKATKDGIRGNLGERKFKENELM